MCGIMGVLGRKGAARLVHKGLQALEYRGYDSCGVAWIGDDGIGVARAVGAVANLHVDEGDEDTALGHTRWATHGGVKEENAHPHLDNGNTVAVVHNGVLLNHVQMRKDLEAQGAKFRGETDSECLAHFWASLDGKTGLERLREIQGVLEGTYSVGFLSKDEGVVYFAKNRNPLWIATVDGTTFFASDAVALRGYTDTAIPVEDGDHGIIKAGAFQVFDARGDEVERPTVDISGIDDRVDKAGYEHYMLKEIHECPDVLNRMIARFVRHEAPWVDLGIPDDYMRRYQAYLGLGAGTSHHAAILGDDLHERLALVPGEARPTPEYKDDVDIPREDTLLVCCSQSGETLDTLQALHRLRSHDLPCLALTNHPTSSIGRAADIAVPLLAGIEVSVAATKSFLSQCMLLYLLALKKADLEGRIPHGAMRYHTDGLRRLPRRIQAILNIEDSYREVARDLARFDNLFLLAKGLHIPAAMEGALKLKEIAYQHAEAYPAGELKHGPFALLSEEAAVVFLLAPDANQDAVLNSLQEVHARGPTTIVVAMEGSKDPGEAANHVLWVPAVDDNLAPFVFSTAMHLLSYWVAKARGLPIDKPRNLAKSVTVE